MANFDDVPLQRPQEQDPRDEPGGLGPRFSVWVPIAIGLIVVAGIALWYLGSPAPDQEDTVVIQETTERVPAEAPIERGPAEPGDEIDLPPLDDTDALMRDLIARLSAHPRVMAYLTTDHLVRNMTVVVVNIADGKTPSGHLRTVRPTGDFQVTAEGRELVIDRRSYERYNDHAAAVQGLDARGVARFYATIRPRIDDAYRDLGSPHGDFDRSLERAIIELLRTPIPEGDIRVRADSVAYTYDDADVESLSHAQRQFLRMGPDNMRIVKGKLREVAQHLGIPAASLPR
ncbi:MAG: DUF3014 domain-containing protein [Acidobacteria bacterium]|nr:DUF3014 domain-containing protein [Acidobacteriota bacterium]